MDVGANEVELRREFEPVGVDQLRADRLTAKQLLAGSDVLAQHHRPKDDGFGVHAARLSSTSSSARATSSPYSGWASVTQSVRRFSSASLIVWTYTTGVASSSSRITIAGGTWA